MLMIFTDITGKTLQQDLHVMQSAKNVWYVISGQAVRMIERSYAKKLSHVLMLVHELVGARGYTMGSLPRMFL